MKMKFFMAFVPCINKKTSSDFLTKLINCGNTATIFTKSSRCFSASVFFSRVVSKSRTCCSMVESTTLMTFWSWVEG